MMNKLFLLINTFFRTNFFGFVSGHSYLSISDLNKLKKLIYEPQDNLRNIYENKFSKEVGNGKSLSFASGRMAFYSLLRAFNIEEGDEVIITGFTCSVMVNAIIRVGATPIFVDIDLDNYGTSPEDILKKITAKTKAIVAQHSFGIPCRIDEIKTIANINNLKLIEDCALSFKSKYKGVILGNFGDAAIFSTDHSKPINTLTGGLLYTNDHFLFEKINASYSLLPDLSIKHQRNLFQQIKFERILCNPKMNRFYTPLMIIINILEKVNLKKTKTFLNSDSGYKIVSSKYPYPAKLPIFLCSLGIKELDRFNSSTRKTVLDNYLKILNIQDTRLIIPSCYILNDYDIVPLRFVFEVSSDKIKNNLSKFIDSTWYWFKSPVISTSDNLKDFKYKKGSCPNSEKISQNIVNLPVIFNQLENKTIYKKIKKIL